MTGKTHQVLGVTVGLEYLLVAAPPTYNPATLGAVLVFSYLAALLPDIDQPAARIWRLLPAGRTVGKIVDPLLAHRNITHSLVGAGLVGIAIYWLLGSFPVYWGIDTHLLTIAALAAYGSHLLADMFTNEGVPLFFPWRRFFGLPPKPLEGLRVATGKWFENLVIFPAVNIAWVIFIVVHWSKFQRILFK